jgi:hypothetical protein
MHLYQLFTASVPTGIGQTIQNPNTTSNKEVKAGILVLVQTKEAKTKIVQSQTQHNHKGTTAQAAGTYDKQERSETAMISNIRSLELVWLEKYFVYGLCYIMVFVMDSFSYILCLLLCIGLSPLVLELIK